MADIKTHLRELSVGVTIGILKNNLAINYSKLYESNYFYNLASELISNDISSARNILAYRYFEGELKEIIDNGVKLGIKIMNSPEFNIKKQDRIIWQGNDTQKGDPIDLVVGDYPFSLKEDSFILKNMGLYTLLNNLTGSSFPRGLHVFSTFAPDEYDDWFQYTWNSLIKFLSSNGDWFLRDGSNLSIAKICNHNILLQFNNDTSLVPINISTNRDFMDYTNARTREKVFSKWIKNHAIYDQEYKQIKGHCSYVAGERLSTYINENYCDSNIYEFFQIYPFTYYYAKTTSTKTSILRVPSQLEYNNYIVFEGCQIGRAHV